MKIFYHTDHDGECSGYWVLKHAKKMQAEGILHPQERIDCVPINYNMPFPIDTVFEQENVYIVDFSIEPDDMRALLEKTSNVVWIDHHKTAIEKYDDFEHEINGIRKDGVAGCVLTYQYFHPDKSVPSFTAYIGDRDIWKYEFGDDTRFFCLGLQAYTSDPEAEIWSRLDWDANNAPNDEALLQRIVTEGATVTAYRDNWAKNFRTKFGFEVEFEGYNCFAMNLGQCGSEYFGEAVDEYDIVIPFIYDGKHKNWLYSMYTTKENIDVSEIAKKHGGGGHKGAAGFDKPELIF